MSGILIDLIIQIVAGVIGAHAAGATLKNCTLGTVGNTIAGAIGGGGGGRAPWQLKPWVPRRAGRGRQHNRGGYRRDSRRSATCATDACARQHGRQCRCRRARRSDHRRRRWRRHLRHPRRCDEMDGGASEVDLTSVSIVATTAARWRASGGGAVGGGGGGGAGRGVRTRA